MTANEALRLTRQTFPGAKVLYATNGEQEIGNRAWDDPQPVPYAQAPDRVTDRAIQAGLQAMRDMVAGQGRSRL